MEVISQYLGYFVIVIAIVAVLFAWAYFTKRLQKDFTTMTVGTFTPNRTPMWLYRILASLPYRMPVIGISNMALGRVK